MATVIATGEACTECVQVIANGEGTDEHHERMDAWLDGTPGVLVVACSGDEEDADEDTAHVTFSWARCDTCGSTLGGERCPVAWFD